MEINKQCGELIILEEDKSETQRKLREWVNDGYSIKILEQFAHNDGSLRQIVTTLVRKHPTEKIT